MKHELQPKEKEAIVIVDGEKSTVDLQKKHTMISILVLAGIAFISIFALATFFKNPQNHAGSLAVLDEKKAAALAITASITAVAALLGIISEGIGDMLSGLTMPLVLIVGVLYFEEFFLTISPYLVFTYIIPIACGLAIAGICMNQNWMKQFAAKLGAFGLVMVLLVPTSVTITKLVDTTFEERINQTYEKVEQAETEIEEENERGGLFGWVDKIGDEIEKATEKTKNTVNNFVDAIAVLLITTCGIPLLVIIVFMWILKLIFGIDIPMDGIKKTMKINPLKESKKMLKKK